MLWQEFSPLTRDAKIEPERMMRLGAGAAVAPMWAAYLAATGVGVTYWWMTAWTRRLGVGAESKSFAAAEGAVAPLEPIAFAPPVEPAVESTAEPVAEAFVAPIEVVDTAEDLADPAAIDLAHVIEEPAFEAPQTVAEMAAAEAEAVAPAEVPAAVAARPARRKPAPKLDA